MNALLEIAMSNILMAGALALPATLAGLWGKRPAFTHGLWLLVLLKLVTPPLFQVPIIWSEPVTPPAETQPVLAALPEPQADTPAAPVDDAPAGRVAREMPADVPIVNMPNPEQPDGAAVPQPQPVDKPPVALAPVAAEVVDIPWTTWLGWFGLTGSALWLVLAAWRLRRFQRLLRFAVRASDSIQEEARALAKTLGVRCPQVLLMPAAISPMLWVGRSPRLLLPEGLVARLRSQQLATVMAHELAHWRRGDHRVRWLEMLALSLYWWCPLAWWARRQLQQAEEECCDAWVVAMLPDAARDYALALVDTIDFLSGASTPLPPVASGVGHVRLLKRRLTMILRGTTPQALTRAGLLGVAGLGLFLLPFVPGRAQQPAEKTAVEKAVDFLTQAQRQQGTPPPQADVDKVRQVQHDLEKRHQALEEQRRLVEMQLKELAAVLQQLNAQNKDAPAKPSAGPAQPGIRVTTGGPKGPMMGGTDYYQIKPVGAHAVSVEQRLEQVERKLDALLWEITNMRRDMSKGHTGGGFGGGIMMVPKVPPGMAPNGPGGAGGGGKPGNPGGTPGLPGRPGGPGGAGGPMGGAPPQVSPSPAPTGGALPQAFTPPADPNEARPTPPAK